MVVSVNPAAFWYSGCMARNLTGGNRGNREFHFFLCSLCFLLFNFYIIIAEMTDSLPNLDLQPGKPPMLRVDTTDAAPRWAAEHRDALRAPVAERGSLLVRGRALRDAAEIAAAFRQLGSLMSAAEALASGRGE